MKLTEYKMKYAKSDRQIDMTGARLTPVAVLLRLYAEYKDDPVFVLLCGEKVGSKRVYARRYKAEFSRLARRRTAPFHTDYRVRNGNDGLAFAKHKTEVAEHCGKIAVFGI